MEIAVTFSTEGLFGSWPPDDRAGVDVAASKLRFVEEVKQVLEQDFPEADISVVEKDGLDSVMVRPYGLRGRHVGQGGGYRGLQRRSLLGHAGARRAVGKPGRSGERGDMSTYYIVAEHPNEGGEYFVEVVTEEEQRPRCVAGPFRMAGHAWQAAERLATSAVQSVAHGIAHYTVLPSDLAQSVDPERPGPRGCWKLPGA